MVAGLQAAHYIPAATIRRPMLAAPASGILTCESIPLSSSRSVDPLCVDTTAPSNNSGDRMLLYPHDALHLPRELQEEKKKKGGATKQEYATYTVPLFCLTMLEAISTTPTLPSLLSVMSCRSGVSLSLSLSLSLKDVAAAVARDFHLCGRRDRSSAAEKSLALRGGCLCSCPSLGTLRCRCCCRWWFDTRGGGAGWVAMYFNICSCVWGGFVFVVFGGVSSYSVGEICGNGAGVPCVS